MSEDIRENVPAPEVEKTRYSDEELAEFKVIIKDKLDKARKEYDTLRQVIMHNGSNDIEDTTPSFKTVEDDGAYQLSKEEASQREVIVLISVLNLLLQSIQERNDPSVYLRTL